MAYKTPDISTIMVSVQYRAGLLLICRMSYRIVGMNITAIPKRTAGYSMAPILKTPTRFSTITTAISAIITRQINAMRRSASALKSRIRTSVKSMVCPLCQKRSGFSPPP